MRGGRRGIKNQRRINFDEDSLTDLIRGTEKRIRNATFLAIYFYITINAYLRW